MSRTPQKQNQEKEVGERFVKEYFPNVNFSDFEIRKLGQMLLPVLNAAKATAQYQNRPQCHMCGFDEGLTVNIRGRIVCCVCKFKPEQD